MLAGATRVVKHALTKQKVTVTNPYSDNLVYVPVAQDVRSATQLSYLFSRHDTNVASYGDGTSWEPEKVAANIKKWGERFEAQNPLCAFLIYNKDDLTKPVIMINLGLSGMKIGDKAVLEGGALSSDTLNETPELLAEALDAVFGEYTSQLASTALSVAALQYTISRSNPAYPAFKICSSLAEQWSIEYGSGQIHADLLSSGRFKVDPAKDFMERATFMERVKRDPDEYAEKAYFSRTF